MKNSVRYILFLGLTAIFSTGAFADVKVKSRQTMSGQTTESTTFIKGKRQRTEQNVGGNQMVTLTQCDLKRGVQLNPQTQVYIINSWEQDADAPTTRSVSGNTRKEVKKGGGGFGNVLGKVVGQTGIGQTGNTAGNVAGQVATRSIVAATSNVKAKDELTLDVKLQNGAALALNKQFKQKAKSNGEDIISPVVEQAANAVVTAVSQ